MKLSESYVILDFNEEILDIIFKSQEDAINYIFSNIPKNMREHFRAEKLNHFIHHAPH